MEETHGPQQPIKGQQTQPRISAPPSLLEDVMLTPTVLSLFCQISLTAREPNPRASSQLTTRLSRSMLRLIYFQAHLMVMGQLTCIRIWVLVVSTVGSSSGAHSRVEGNMWNLSSLGFTILLLLLSILTGISKNGYLLEVLDNFFCCSVSFFLCVVINVRWLLILLWLCF